MRACQKRKCERAFMIPSEFEPAVSMMELYRNMFFNLIDHCKESVTFQWHHC